MNILRSGLFAYQIRLTSRRKIFWFYLFFITTSWHVVIGAHISDKRPTGEIPVEKPEFRRGDRYLSENPYASAANLTLLRSALGISGCLPQILTDQQGSVWTTNFPNSSHQLSHCGWVIVGRENAFSLIYLTEVYLHYPGGINVESFVLKNGVKADVVDYGLYHAANLPHNSTLHVTQPYVFIKIIPEGTSAAHAHQKSIDLHGANITYSIVGSEQNISSGYQCTGHADCSYLGRCMFSSSLEESFCSCFEGHHGPKCQFGPMCHPLLEPRLNPCHNGGECAYVSPVNVTCSCPPALAGPRCDSWKPDAIPQCADLNCELGCVIDSNQKARCRCRVGERPTDDPSMCTSVLEDSPTSSTVPPPPCRIYLTATNGVVQTPNFPGMFPIPLKCEWIIRAGQGNDTVIYFTEIYHKFPARLEIFTYDSYVDGEETAVGKKKVPNPVQGDENNDWFDADYSPDNLTVTGNYVVLRFELQPSTDWNIYDNAIRVKPFFIDIHGFNLTYSVFPTGQVKNRHSCHPYSCSFLGACRASRDYSHFFCDCADRFFGDRCQYGPRCNPVTGENFCINGGACSYEFGTDGFACKCPPGFEGPKCASYSRKPNIEECNALHCEHRCLRKLNGTGMECQCDPGFRIDPLNPSRCVDTGRRRMDVSIDFEAEADRYISATSHLMSRITEMKPEVEDCTFGNTSESRLSFSCTADRATIKRLKEQIEVAKSKKMRLWESFARRIKNYRFVSYPLADIVSLSIYTQEPVVEGAEMALVCIAQGSRAMKFSWAKDGIPFDPSNNRGMWLTEMELDREERKSSQINIENARRVHQGVYTCTVEDQGSKVTQSILIDVLRVPDVVVIPATPSVKKGNPLALTCATTQSSEFKWVRNGEDVRMSPGSHSVVAIWPQEKSSQLIIESVNDDADYTCVASNKAGSREKTVHVKVLPQTATVCHAEKFEAINWRTTPHGSEAEELCPLDSIGKAKRRCRDGKWMKPDLSDCASIAVLQLKTAVESTQAGFGSQDTENLQNLAERVHGLLAPTRDLPPRSRDMSIIIELLEILLALADTMSEARAAKVREELEYSLNVVMERLDSLNSSLEFLNRFRHVSLEKNLTNGQEALYIASGSFPCQLENETRRLPFNETELVTLKVCTVIPAPKRRVPGWIQASVDYVVKKPSDYVTERLRGAYVLFSRQAPQIFKGTVSLGESVELNLPRTWIPKGAEETALNATFYNFSRIDPFIQLPPASGKSSDVMHEPRCMQRNARGTWSPEFCSTYWNLSEATTQTLQFISCVCRIHANQTLVTVLFVNMTVQDTRRDVAVDVRPHDFVAPLVLGIFAACSVFMLFIWLIRKKKLLSCLVTVKKRTCDFLLLHGEHSSLQPTSAEQIQLRERSAVVGRAPTVEEVTSLMAVSSGREEGLPASLA